MARRWWINRILPFARRGLTPDARRQLQAGADSCREMPVSFTAGVNESTTLEGVIRSYGHLFAMCWRKIARLIVEVKRRAKPMPSGCMILTCAGVWLTPDLKCLLEPR